MLLSMVTLLKILILNEKCYTNIMKITIVLIVWMLLTLILVLSVIGLVLLLPKPNFTDYNIDQEESRSTWMRIGYGLYEKLIQD